MTDESCIEVAAGLRTRPDVESAEVAACAAPQVVVVAEGLGGHGCGWVGARRVVRALARRFARGDAPALVGAAQDAISPRLQARWVSDHADPPDADLPLDLAEAFAALETTTLKLAMPGGKHLAVDVGCTAGAIDGARIHGAHAGRGRVALLRATEERFHDLVTPHLLDRIAPRSADVPRNILVNAIGMLATSGIGVDRFEVDLGAGDVLLLASRELDLHDDDLVALVRQHAKAPLAQLGRAIEDQRRDARREIAGDLAFAIARCTRR